MCGAKLRRKDAHCKSTVLFSNNRCRLHGGETPSGLASTNYKHGKYAGRYWSLLEDAGLKDLAERALNDNVEVRDSIDAMELLQLRIQSLLQDLSSTDWSRAFSKAWKNLKSAGLEKNEVAQREAFREMETLMSLNEKQSRAWREVYRLEEQLDKMRDRLLRREFVAGNLIKVEYAKFLISATTVATKNAIKSRFDMIGRMDLYYEAVNEIATEVGRITGRTRAEVLSSEDNAGLLPMETL